MNTHIQTYLSRAHLYHKRLQENALPQDKLSLTLVDCVYNLRQIRIAVTYRSTQTPLSRDDKVAIEEVRQICEEAESVWKQVHQRKKLIPVQQ